MEHGGGRWGGGKSGVEAEWGQDGVHAGWCRVGMEQGGVGQCGVETS